MKTPYRVRHGGLLRCCLESLDNQLVAAETEPDKGTVLTCEFCHKPTLLRAPDGTWEWSKPQWPTLTAPN